MDVSKGSEHGTSASQDFHVYSQLMPVSVILLDDREMHAQATCPEVITKTLLSLEQNFDCTPCML